mmetsp:Transcript_48622/g.135205  ORF Transcript_48622/g.135205 Transcript_48622/m.135205 type:complete len:80 (-) Transcript_48622:1182-1421(-)
MAAAVLCRHDRKIAAMSRGRAKAECSTIRAQKLRVKGIRSPQESTCQRNNEPEVSMPIAASQAQFDGQHHFVHLVLLHG